MDFDDEKEADNSIDVDHPIEFCCPIGLDLMHDPVLLVEDGHTYERSQLERWLKSQNTSPVTNQKINSKQFCPNYALKHHIDKYKKKLQAEEVRKFSIELFRPCNGIVVQSSPKVRIQMLGDINTGKTSFVKFAEFSEYEPTLATIGVDINLIQLVKPYRGKSIVAEIRDIAGQFDRYNSLARQLYRDAHGCILMCSVDRADSVKSLKKSWIKEVYDNAPDNVYCLVILNKYDLVNNGEDQQKLIQYRRVEKEAREFAKDNGYPFYTTSSKSGAYVHIALKELVHRIIRDSEIWRELVRRTDNDSLKSVLTEVSNEDTSKKRTCCSPSSSDSVY